MKIHEFQAKEIFRAAGIAVLATLFLLVGLALRGST